MGLFDFLKGSDTLRCDEQDFLVWKWRPKGESAFCERANNVRSNSQIHVNVGEVAVLATSGGFQFFEGPADDTLKITAKGNAEVYFLNISRAVKVPFGIPFFNMQDPRFPELSVPVAVGGTLSIKIEDYKEFTHTNKLTKFTIDNFFKEIVDVMERRIKGVMTNVLHSNDIPLVHVERHIETLSDMLRDRLAPDFKEYGIVLRDINLESIDIDKYDKNWKKLQQVTADYSVRSVAQQQEATLKTAQAETDLKIDKAQRTQDMQLRDLDERLRIQREDNQYEKRKKIQSENLAAFSIEKQAEAAVAAAEAAAANGGRGFGGLSGASSGPSAPPPMPGQFSAPYYVVVDGQQAGPFEKNVLEQMVSQGKLTQETLV